MSGRPVVVKRIKRGAHGHHGGAWKVAYADFVTAMMAFFLLLWLLNAVTEEQLEGISNYFSPMSTARATSGANGMLTGRSLMVSPTGPPPVSTEEGDGDADGRLEADGLGENEDPSQRSAADAALDARIAERDEAQFRAAEAALRQTLAGMPEFKTLAKSLLVENVPEGLRIQIVDQEALPMFPRGSAEMYLHARKLLEVIAKVVAEMPQDLAITGHTDATPYLADNGYSNWELSADRANAARRALVRYRVAEARFSRVVGKAATEPLLPDDPDAPANRRLSVVLLRGSAGNDRVMSVPR